MVTDQDEIWKSKYNYSTMLYSKPFKQLYMNSIYKKYLRNEELKQLLIVGIFCTTTFYEERFGEKYCQLSSNNNYCNTISDKNNLLNYSQASYSYWNQTFFEFSSNPSTHYENPFSFSAAEIIFDGCWLDLCKRFICNSLQRSGVHYNNEIFTFDIDLGTDAMKL
ncbi:unnamed protein product [Rotaria sp. Silwood2]|nr:unnamed protein product [Rotaria sp. Silwood2]